MFVVVYFLLEKAPIYALLALSLAVGVTILVGEDR
jgi:hypothetical protein